MNNIEILNNALEYIEQNLQKEIKTEDVAGACYCSKSVLEKIFRCVYQTSVHDYLIRRRMMKAARLIFENEKLNLLEVALMFGYSTNESFTRAFKNVWNMTPSEFRSKSRFSELFPRLYPPIEDGGTYMNKRRNVDISELYDLFVVRKNCYFVCCDIKNLISINDISRKAGDIAIREALNRVEEAAGEEDIFFRIGGDEFAMLTNSEEKEYAQNIAEKIKENNGKPIIYEGREIPLHLYTSVIKMEGDYIRYRDLFNRLHTNILENK